MSAHGPTLPSAPVEPESLVGRVVAERYRVVALLGAGGMGAVYRAEHVHMKKPVALKVLHRELTLVPEVVARFEREAVAAGRIDSPHVAAATDFGKLDDGAFYLVLEFAAGRSLRDLLDAEGTLPESRALHVARQIVSALEAAHAAGIVHRDLKPDNVMLVEREGDPEFVKVLDFGIAKLTQSDDARQLTQLGTVFGTPEYMAPEQARGDLVDSRADLYTVGMILYEMLAGATPFAGDDVVQVLTRQLTEAPAPLPLHVDRDLAALVQRLLSKDPSERPQTAQDLGAALDALSGVFAGAVSQPALQLLQLDAPSSQAALSSPTPGPVSGAPASGPDQTAEAIAAATAIAQRAWAVLIRRVPVAGNPVPIWGFLVAALSVVGLGFVLVITLGVALHAGSRPASASASAAPSASIAPIKRTPPATLAGAASGDLTALGALEAVPEEEREPEDWTAIGAGRGGRGEYRAAVRAFTRAAAAGVDFSKDEHVLALLRRAADDSEAGADAVELATKLGSSGADLLYDVLGESKRPDVKRAAEQALDRPAVRSKASPALLVALELRAARGCASYKAALPQAALHADARSYKPLKALSATKGCGFLRMRDCWPCVRGDANLALAQSRAEAEAAPKFTTAP